MPSNEYTFTGGDESTDIKRWVEDETDLTHDSPFHTIGRGATQAASGNHKHSANEISDLPTGLALSDAVPKADSGSGSPGVGGEPSRADHVHPAGPGGLELGNTVPPADSGIGGVGSSTFAAKADHYHPSHNSAYADSAGNADSVDGQHFGWSNPGTWPTYFWGVNTNGGAGFLIAGSRVPRVFTGSTTPSGQKTGDIWAY